MPAEERDPDLRQARNVARSRGLAQRLATPLDRVRRLQTSLQAKAKAEPTVDRVHLGNTGEDVPKRQAGESTQWPVNGGRLP